MAEERTNRRLAAIMAADVAGYTRLMAADEAGTLARLKRLRAQVIEPKVAQFQGHIVGSAGDSLLVEFASAINVGDIIAADDTIHGDGVNIAARLEKLAEPGSVCIGRNVYDQVKGKLDYAFTDLGGQRMHNIPEPVRAYRVKPLAPVATGSPTRDSPPLPDKPSIAVLPFQNMSGDPEQEYFVDGMAEEIITGLSRLHWLFVIARNSSFTYKGRAVDVKQVGRELGVR
jgi:adenylate cyclase